MTLNNEQFYTLFHTGDLECNVLLGLLSSGVPVDKKDIPSLEYGTKKKIIQLQSIEQILYCFQFYTVLHIGGFTVLYSKINSLSSKVGTKFFMPTGLGFSGTYCRNGRVPVNGIMCSSTDIRSSRA